MNIRASPISQETQVPFGLAGNNSLSNMADMFDGNDPSKDLFRYIQRHPWKVLDYPWMLDRCPWIIDRYPYLFRQGRLGVGSQVRSNVRHFH